MLDFSIDFSILKLALLIFDLQCPFEALSGFLYGDYHH